MAFGLKAPATGDIPDLVKIDARAGRMIRVDYNAETREKVQVDITTPPPRFAVDFARMQLGYVWFPPSGPPEYITVPVGQPLPKEPTDKDETGKRKFRAVVRLQVYGKIMVSASCPSGLRDLSPTANIVQEPIEDLYNKYCSAAEAQQGQIPIVEMTRVIPVQMGKPPKQTTNYMPCFIIVGWIDRVPTMGERLVPPPLGAPRTSIPPAAVTFEPQGVTSAKPLPQAKGGGSIIDDEIPFSAFWQ